MAATESTIRFSGHTLDKATKAKVISFFLSLTISLFVFHSSYFVSLRGKFQTVVNQCSNDAYRYLYEKRTLTVAFSFTLA